MVSVLNVHTVYERFSTTLLRACVVVVVVVVVVIYLPCFLHVFLFIGTRGTDSASGPFYSRSTL